MPKATQHRRYRANVSELPDWLRKKKRAQREKFLSGQRIQPANITGKESVERLVDETFLAYNAARLKEGCQLFTEKMLAPDVTVGMTLSGALTPAGLGCSSVIPLIKAGFVDWIVGTGANLYHDLHFALNYPVRVGSFRIDDTELRKNDIVRIYDVLLGYSDCLMATDEILRAILIQPEFQKEMGTAELHHLLGKYAAEWERKNKLKDVSVLAAAYRAGVPCYTSSPGDSTIGMNVAGVELRGNRLRINPSIDVNETTAFVLAAKRAGGKSAVVLWGGGSPKNFMLQTEPQIQEVLRIKEFGQDYFLQVTDARPDTGGLSGATPSEAVSWGKVDPNRLPDAVVCYTDTTIAMPILTHYALAKHKPRALKRLYDQRERMTRALVKEYFLHNRVKMIDGSEPVLE
ncbi:MAG TPA: deoxyhypusine synthase [Candidatus Paceibacterota bacterium]|nr:deoxyhypusine synthase [Verrucomicrobiota bacterium]HOX03187.1 deoxyhypusine synthase [Verrucomicrobiota bacterium]HRZ46109.1 deoxyhypusine synthase [Candidatus Paceibacterota bacterium]HRZ54075.1 deoxyhypusine synthase [Candidatus Paceibacterota bacterium]